MDRPTGDGDGGSAGGGSPSAARTLRVLEALVRTPSSLTLTALAEAAEVPPATCSAIVRTLEARGYAARRVVGRSHFWTPTLGLYALGVQLVRNVDLATVALGEMQALADRLGMPVHLGALSGTSVVYVAKAASAGFIQFDTYPGKVAAFNVTALGKAIAASLPSERLGPLLDHLQAGRGPGALPNDPSSFTAQLDEIRARGYALEAEESQPDVGCVAVPFFGADGDVAGAAGVTGFTRDLLGPKLQDAIDGAGDIARLVSTRLGHVPADRR